MLVLADENIFCSSNNTILRTFLTLTLKPGFHYPSWRLTGFHYPSTHGPSTRLVEMHARQHGPWWRLMETGHPSTRVVETGLKWLHHTSALAKLSPRHLVSWNKKNSMGRSPIWTQAEVSLLYEGWDVLCIVLAIVKAWYFCSITIMLSFLSKFHFYFVTIQSVARFDLHQRQQSSHNFSSKIFPMTFTLLSATSKDHFPWPHDVSQQCTIFYFYIITRIRNITFYQLQAIYPIYYITLTKMDRQLTSEMSLEWISLC